MLSHIVLGITIFAALSSFVLPAAAQSSSRVSGNELVEFCAPNSDIPPFACAGYVLGVSDFLEIQMAAAGTQSAVGLCFPGNVTRKQKLQVIAKYLGGHPEELHHEAAALVFKALVEAFPCR